MLSSISLINLCGLQDAHIVPECNSTIFRIHCGTKRPCVSFRWVCFFGFSFRNNLTQECQSSRDVSQRVDGFESHGIVQHLGSRSPRARSGVKATRSRPSRSSNKKTSTRKKTSTKKKSNAKKTSTKKKSSAKKVPVKGKTTTRRKKSTVRKKKPVKKRPTKKRPTSRKPTRTRSARPSITKRPTSAKHKSSSTVKLLPFTLPPRPTVASDACLIPGIDCGVDLKARSEAGHQFAARSFRNPSIEKRNRDFAVNLKGGELELNEKNYYYSSQLEDGLAGSRWVKAWVDYETLLLKDVEVKLYNTKPAHLGRGRVYRSEHILEVNASNLGQNTFKVC